MCTPPRARSLDDYVSNNTTSCDAQGFKHTESGKSETLLLDYVEKYFASGVDNPDERVRVTNLPPIYFQHAGTWLKFVIGVGHVN
jgi:hypothetical protein